MEFMFEWEADGDRFSFEDSDRFEDDSLCSWISEPESLCNNWRGWRKPNCNTGGAAAGTGSAQSAALSTQASASSRDSRSNGTVFDAWQLLFTSTGYSCGILTLTLTLTLILTLTVALTLTIPLTLTLTNQDVDPSPNHKLKQNSNFQYCFKKALVMCRTVLHDLSVLVICRTANQ